MYREKAFFGLITCCFYFGVSTTILAAELELLTIGDSITAGLIRGSDGIISCPAGVALGPALFSDTDTLVCNGEGAEGVGGHQPILKSNIEEAGYDVLIYNFGYSGMITSDMVGLTNSFLSQKLNTDYVLLMGGANDAFTNISASTVNFNIRLMIKTICQTGMTPVITTITRRQSDSSINNIVIGYNNLINQIENPAECSSQNIELVRADQYNATINATNFSDGLHLTATGNLNMATEWYSVLDLPILGNTEMEFLPSVYLLLDE